MRLRPIYENDFRIIFDKIPAKTILDYRDCIITLYTSTEPIIGFSIQYKLNESCTHEEFHYIDLSELNQTLLQNILQLFYNYDDGEIEMIKCNVKYSDNSDGIPTPELIFTREKLLNEQNL